MTRHSFLLDDAMAAYVAEHSPRPDAIQAELIEETSGLPTSGMQVAPEQGAFLALLVSLIGARHVLEVGTFTGYSSLCMARALPPDGRIICCDVSEEWTGIARRYWERAGVADRIELRLGRATDTLRAMPERPTFDFAFLDADKGAYPTYLDLIVNRLRPGGLLVADNVLWGGHIVDPGDQRGDTVALRRFNDLAAAHPRLETHLLTLFDGLLVARVVR